MGSRLQSARSACREFSECVDVSNPVSKRGERMKIHEYQAKELFRALIPLKIRWLSQCSVTIAHDEELLALAAQSGCIDLFLGIESISTASLAEVGKKINKVEEYEEIIKKLHKMTEQQARKELEAVGLVFVSNEEFLPQQHFLVFEKP